ncbi:Putative uncharacterized protein FLJ37770 [Eumeta japonica]|uniref:Uncharacterized protein n=1 Tax=Eumeta variegata TaxID=151549 RepID=A0A4C1ZZQ4_EUMVA|nr:Putative uncharacterized protein FLJ37770 [Eumeta japonica]
MQTITSARVSGVVKLPTDALPVTSINESAPSYTMVEKWARLFQQGQRAVKMILAGRPVTVVTEENVRKIEKLVLADQRIKLWQIAEELQISKE